MKHPLFRRLLAAALLGCCLNLPAIAAEGGGTVNAADVNLRTAAGTDSAIVTTVAKSTPVVVLDRQNKNWYRVLATGKEGYMSADYIDYAEKLEAAFGRGTVSGDTVRFRSGPGTSAAVLGFCSAGAELDVLGVEGAWYKVSRQGAVGYVHSDYVVLPGQSLATAVAATVPQSAGSTIVATASQYMGVPYVWAGTSPKGFDCSGFVYYVFKENGYATNRTAASLFNNGTYVERSQLQPGDVICFYSGGYGSIGHVGIYIGENQFIHASSSQGRVTIDSLATGYYNSHYYGARRIA